MDSIVFTPAALLDLLSKIDELSDYNISVTQTFDNQIQITIGDSTYIIDDENVTSVNVDESVVGAVEDANEEAYENLDESFEVSYDDETPIESGIIKEIAKTLLVGGMVRLAGKLMK